MACEDIGNFNGPPQDFVSVVLAADQTGDCQRGRVGSTSPGPVEDNETLARFVFAPAHISKVTGDIDETLVADAFKFGASVSRVHADWENALAGLHLNGEAQAERIRLGSEQRPPQPDRLYVGIVRFTAADARAVSVDVTRARIRVYDTSLPDDPLHGDIVADDRGLPKALRKELRVRLFLQVQKSGLFRLPVD